MNTSYLFTYGTLQDNDIQIALFGRKIEGIKDILLGYKISEQKYEGIYPVLYHSGNLEDSIQGKIYEITSLELEKADEYEGPDYQRIEVILASDNKAWVYVGK